MLLDVQSYPRVFPGFSNGGKKHPFHPLSISNAVHRLFQVHPVAEEEFFRAANILGEGRGQTHANTHDGSMVGIYANIKGVY